jgi:hypothetical protein
MTRRTIKSRATASNDGQMRMTVNVVFRADASLIGWALYDGLTAYDEPIEKATRRSALHATRRMLAANGYSAADVLADSVIVGELDDTDLLDDARARAETLFPELDPELIEQHRRRLEGTPR